MMLLVQRPTVSECKHEVCNYHKRNPGKSWPGCTCSSSYSCREKTFEEMTAEEKHGYLAAMGVLDGVDQ